MFHKLSGHVTQVENFIQLSIRHKTIWPVPPGFPSTALLAFARFADLIAAPFEDSYSKNLLGRADSFPSHWQPPSPSCSILPSCCFCKNLTCELYMNLVREPETWSMEVPFGCQRWFHPWHVFGNGWEGWYNLACATCLLCYTNGSLAVAIRGCYSTNGRNTLHLDLHYSP